MKPGYSNSGLTVHSKPLRASVKVNRLGSGLLQSFSTVVLLLRNGHVR